MPVSVLLKPKGVDRKCGNANYMLTHWSLTFSLMKKALSESWTRSSTSELSFELHLIRLSLTHGSVTHGSLHNIWVIPRHPKTISFSIPYASIPLRTTHNENDTPTRSFITSRQSNNLAHSYFTHLKHINHDILLSIPPHHNEIMDRASKPDCSHQRASHRPDIASYQERRVLGGIMRQAVDTKERCPMCYDCLTDQKICVLRCKHVYCFHCAEKWYWCPQRQDHDTGCPYCRQKTLEVVYVFRVLYDLLIARGYRPIEEMDEERKDRSRA